MRGTVAKNLRKAAKEAGSSNWRKLYRQSKKAWNKLPHTHR